MKLLVLCNRIPFPAKDGGSIAMLNMIKGLAAQEIDLSVLAFNTKKHYINLGELPPELQHLAQWHTVYLDASVTVTGALKSLLNGSSYNLSRFNNKSMHLKLEQLLKNQEFDVVQLEGFFMSPYVNTIRKFSSAKIVMRTHNVEHFIWERLAVNEKSFLKKYYLNILANRLKKEELERLNSYDAIAAMTEADALFFRKHGAKVPVLVSPAGIEFEKYANLKNIKPEPESIFHLGSLDWQPNQEAVYWFLKNVWPLVYAQKPTATFTVAGRNMPPEMKSLKAEGVNMLGEVEDAIAFMHTQQLMVVPLLSGSGMRLKIIEGMAAGKAIVSTTIGAEGIDVTHRKDILLADDASAFAQNILELLSNSHLVEKISSAAQTLAKEKYSNTAIVKELAAIYKDGEVWLSGK